jgi:hypothetical protein
LEQGLELCEHHLDGVQVGAVRRQEQQMRAGGADGAAHGLALVTAEGVEHHDVTGGERGHQELLHPCEEQRSVDRSVDHAGRVDAVVPQSGDEGHGGPVAVRHMGDQTLSPRGAAVGACHVGLGPGLVDEDQAGGVDARLMATPARAAAGDVGPMLFGGVQAFF